MASNPLNKTNSWNAFEQSMMALALRLAKKGCYLARPNPMVGCVLTQGETLVAQGWHQKVGTAHAEVNALKDAGIQAKGATCFVTLEPCAHQGRTGPCAKALIDAGVAKVIAAMQDPNPQVAGKGFEMLKKAGIEVECGLLETQAKTLNRGFISRITKGRPFISCKLAMSLDGRTALSNGQSQWITASAARLDVQKLRARQDAILTGIGTALTDDPSLTVRDEDILYSQVQENDQLDGIDNLNSDPISFEQPVRILLDRKARANYSLKLFNDDAKVIWVSESASFKSAKTHVTCLSHKGDLAGLFNKLASLELNNLLVEAGPELAGAFLQAGLIDELVVYMAPKLMGNEANALFNFPLASMDKTPLLTLKDLTQVGDDLRLTYEIEKSCSRE